MKSFNAKSLPREHRLFLKKRKKLSLTSENGEHVIFKIRNYDINNRERAEFQITSGLFSYGSCYKQLNRIIPLYTITQKIKEFEYKHNIKISDIGLTRKDFSKNMNLEKIDKAIKGMQTNK